MAKSKMTKLIDRLTLGTEKDEGYAKSTLPSNRWELFGDVFKGNFGKLLLINIIVLLFVIPFVVLFFFREFTISGYGLAYPFSQGFGVGYGALPSVVGYAEQIICTTNMYVLLFLPIAFIFIALGLSGGAQVMKNMVWGEGVFVANDFFKGIKQNFKQVCLIFLVYSVIIYLTALSLSLVDYMRATGEMANAWAIVIKAISIGVVILYSIMTLYMVSLSVTYELKAKALIKNAFLFTFGILPQNLLFGVLAILPTALCLLMFVYLGLVGMIGGIILLILFGFSLPILIWTIYSQWAFDKYLNAKVAGAKKNRGIYEKKKGGESDTAKKYREQHEMLPPSAFGLRPIKPITDEELKIEELSEGFSREDILRLNESKQRLYEDNERYIKEHENDPEFVEARKLQESADEERQKRIERAKRELKKGKK